MAVKTVTYTYEAKPILLNRWRSLHFAKCSAIRKEWRETFFYLAKANPHVFTQPVDIAVRHEVKKGVLPDVGSPMECVKAAIDGIVGSGTIEDDSPKFLKSITFLAPEKTGRDALSITFTEIKD